MGGFIAGLCLVLAYTPSAPQMPYLEADTLVIALGQIDGDLPQTMAVTDSLESLLVRLGGDIPVRVARIGSTLPADCGNDEAFAMAGHSDPTMIVWGELRNSGGEEMLALRGITGISQNSLADSVQSSPYLADQTASGRITRPAMMSGGMDDMEAMALVVLGQGSVLTGRFTLGEELLFQALRKVEDPEESFLVAAWFYLGNARLAQGDLARAESAYKSLLDADPDVFWAMVNLGNVYYAMNRMEDAVEWLTKAIEEEPTVADVYYTRGTAQCHLGRQELGIEDFTRVLELNPTDSQAIGNRGFAYYELAMLDEARDDFLKAIEIGGGSTRLYSNLGLTYMFSNENELALDCFNSAMEYPEAGDQQLWLRGCSYCNMGSFLEGAADFTVLLATGEDSVQYLGDRALALYVAGYCEKAAEDFRNMMRVEPERVNYWQLHLGRALYKAHDVQGALAAMQEIIDRDGQGEYGSTAAARAESWSDGELEEALSEQDAGSLLTRKTWR